MRVHLPLGSECTIVMLKLKGYVVSGSDDSIFEPSKSRLKKHGLFPEN